MMSLQRNLDCSIHITIDLLFLLFYCYLRTLMMSNQIENVYKQNNNNNIDCNALIIIKNR